MCEDINNKEESALIQCDKQLFEHQYDYRKYEAQSCDFAALMFKYTADKETQNLFC